MIISQRLRFSRLKNLKCEKIEFKTVSDYKRLKHLQNLKDKYILNAILVWDDQIFDRLDILVSRGFFLFLANFLCKKITGQQKRYYSGLCTSNNNSILLTTFVTRSIKNNFIYLFSYQNSSRMNSNKNKIQILSPVIEEELLFIYK